MTSKSRQILAAINSRERKQFYFLAIAHLAISLLDILSLALILGIIDLYTHASPLMKWVWLIPGSSTPGSLLPISFLLVFFLAKNRVAYRLQEKKFSYVYQVASRLSHQNLLYYFAENIKAYMNTDSAVWIQRISNRPIEFCHYLLAGLLQAVAEISILLLCITAAVFYNPLLFCWLLLLFVPAALLLSYYIRRRIGRARREIRKSGEIALQHLKESLHSFIDSKMYGKTAFLSQRYYAAQQSLNQHLADLQSTQAAPARLAEVYAVAGLFLLLSAQKISGTGNWLNPVMLTAFLGFAYKCIPGAIRLFNLSAQFKTYQYTLAELSPARTIPSPTNTGPVESIAFTQLHCRYDNKDVLTGISGVFRKGYLTGISGLSGQGKTTLLHHLLGFLEPYSGEISFNGKPTTALQRQDYWKRIAYVQQQPFLLNDSLLTNIVLDTEPVDPVRLQEAIEYADLGPFISRQQEGIQFLISENGKNISGGQRQRIALARAFYKNADLLVLDEPFRELDTGAEKKVLLHLRKMAERGRMILLVTHQQASLACCHHIYSLHD